jgi:hypothetical protein
MNGMTRAFATLIAAGVTGLLLWLAAQVDMGTTGGYWAALGLIAAGGVLLGLAQLRGAGGNPPGMFVIAFLPIAIAAGWVLVAAQPHLNWFARHFGAWSSDIGIGSVVAAEAHYLGVLAFGIGLVFGLTLHPATMRRRRAVTPAVTPATAAAMTAAPEPDARAADEPTSAEQREQEDAAAEREPATSSKSTTRTINR